MNDDVVHLTVTILREIRDEIREANTRLDLTNERLDLTNERLERLAHRVDRGFIHLDRRIDHVLTGPVGTMVRDLHERLRTLEGRVDGIEPTPR